MTIHRHAFAVDAACDGCSIMLSELIGELSRALAEARQTIARLNRRCQAAESALADRVAAGGPSFGRALANAAATMYRHQRDEALATLAVVGQHLDRIEALATLSPSKIMWTLPKESDMPAVCAEIVAECRKARG